MSRIEGSSVGHLCRAFAHHAGKAAISSAKVFPTSDASNAFNGWVEKDS
jgi:hypothetical protein